jgi:hypothetical protein
MGASRDPILLDYSAAVRQRLGGKYAVIIIAALHVWWCFAIDYVVWHLLRERFPFGVNPIGMSLLVSFPAGIVLNAAGLAAGLCAYAATSCFVGWMTHGSIQAWVGMPRPLPFGTRLKFYLVLFSWVGWITVPIQYSLYFHWFCWGVPGT